MRSEAKKQRHKQLINLIDSHPLMTDKEIATTLQVSLGTVRLDRVTLSIPEVRERTRSMAEQATSRLKSMRLEEVIGDLVGLEPNKGALSVLFATRNTAFRHTDFVGDYYIYAQAASLAIATIDKEMVVVGSARLKYNRPAYIGEKILARSKVGVHKGNKYVVSVRSTVENREIFVGRFVVVSKDSIDKKSMEAKKC
ncbi:MAG: transcription factor FapR [Synergistaceae bacterium]|nr:transcription factor FapR [Synergistaceae bacterium]